MIIYLLLTFCSGDDDDDDDGYDLDMADFFNLKDGLSGELINK